MPRGTCWAAILATVVTSGLHAQRESSPRVRFIQVEPEVKLEVLDWGGTGRPVVLLAGNTRTAHDFEDFAPKLTSTYHVYLLARR